MKDYCFKLIATIIISTISFNCKIFYFDSWLDYEIYKKLTEEYDKNIAKLSYDQAILKWGKPNNVTNGDSIKIANWDFDINGDKLGTVKVAFSLSNNLIIEWKHNLYLSNDVQSFLSLKKELDSKIGIFSYDNALLNWGKPNYLHDGDNIFIASWDLIINGRYKGIVIVGFDNVTRKMNDWRFSFMASRN